MKLSAKIRLFSMLSTALCGLMVGFCLDAMPGSGDGDDDRAP